MTKKEMFAEIVTIATAADRKDIVEFANKEIERLSAPKSKDSESAKAKVREQTDIQSKIIEILTEMDKPITLSMMMKSPLLAGLSPNKVSAMITKLKKSGDVVRTEVKRVAYFALATDEDVTEVEE